MKIPKRLLRSLRAVKDGADVYSLTVAKELREIEARFPSLVWIGEPMMYQGDGTDVVPYFGAIATSAGKRALRAGL